MYPHRFVISPETNALYSTAYDVYFRHAQDRPPAFFDTKQRDEITHSYLDAYRATPPSIIAALKGLQYKAELVVVEGFVPTPGDPNAKNRLGYATSQLLPSFAGLDTPVLDAATYPPYANNIKGWRKQDQILHHDNKHCFNVTSLTSFNPGDHPSGTQFLTLGTALEDPDFVKMIRKHVVKLRGKDLSEVPIALEIAVKDALTAHRFNVGVTELLKIGAVAYFPDDRLYHAGLSHQTTKHLLKDEMNPTEGDRFIQRSHHPKLTALTMGLMAETHRELLLSRAIS